jgi:hypothetical protein
VQVYEPTVLAQAATGMSSHWSLAIVHSSMSWQSAPLPPGSA